MKTSVIEVHDMVSVLTVEEVEKRICRVPGVESATVNYATGNATVRYDETRLEVADIKVIVHQRGQQSEGDSVPVQGSRHEPAGKPAAVPTPTIAPASASKPNVAMPKTSNVAPAAVPALTRPGGNGQPDKATPSAPPSATVAAPPKPSPDAPVASPAPVASAAPAAKPSTPVGAPPKAAPNAISTTPPATEPKPGSWKVHALSLTVTLSVAYTLCAIFDVLFPRFGLLSALAPASPFPISGSPLAYLTGFALFTVVGFVLGALHGIAWEFWSKRLR